MNFSLVPEIQTSSKEDALCESSNKRKWIRHLEYVEILLVVLYFSLFLFNNYFLLI